MNKKHIISNSILFLDEKIVEQFEKVAITNETTAYEILNDFMKDYIVSNGHPEQVVNRWPWNKKSGPER